MDTPRQSLDYSRIEHALRFIHENRLRQPGLAETARAVGLSEYHFQRMFAAWAGVTPKRFLQFLTKEHAKRLLRDNRDLLHVAAATGLSAPSRLHDLFVHCEAMTPGEYKTAGADLVIDYGFHPTPFGECLIAVTARGLCRAEFVQQDNHAALVQNLRREWPRAALRERAEVTLAFAQRAFPLRAAAQPLHLALKGTNFQIKVWEALLKIPSGSAVSYETVARYLSAPQAVRAVASAVATNPIAFVIPCHRVIRKLGDIGEYAWGRERKQALLGWEAAQIAPSDTAATHSPAPEAAARTDPE